MKKDQPENPLKFVARKVGKMMPVSLPAKIYHAASLFAPTKFAVNAIIKFMIPPSVVIEEGEILLNQKDVAVSGALALGMFEKKEVEAFRNAVRPGMTVIDIGANIGLYTIIAAKRVGSTGKVVAYEPEEENFSLLKKNIEHNKIGNAVLVKTALSDAPGERTLHLAKDNKGHHSFSDDSLAFQKIIVKTETLDDSLLRQGVRKVNLIKIDIEGAEFLAFGGMKETLKRNPELILFTEFFPKNIERLGGSPIAFLQGLNSMGFSLSVINEDKQVIEPIGDVRKFVETFPRGESFRNIYAVRKHGAN